MTELQLKRWQSFSLRMAHRGYQLPRKSSDGGGHVTDIVSDMSEYWNPHYWGDDKARERWEELWGSRIHCCIRAGIDMAVSPSAGVCGFTAGDLRRMFRGDVPDWVTGGKEHRWTTTTVKAVVPGVGFVPGEPKLNGTFEHMPDETAVWL